MNNKMLLKKIGFPLIILLSGMTAWSQSPSGDWFGLLDAQGVQIKLVLHVQPDGNSYRLTLDSPGQGAYNISVTDFTFSDPDFSFSIPEAGLSYDGELNTDFTRIDGTFKQGTLSVPLVFGRDEFEDPDPDLAYLKEHYTKEETYITMRDGVRLFTSIYRPKDESRTYPILMWRTPYSVSPYGEDKFTGRLKFYMHLVREGYVFAFQDVRGKYMSEGKFMDVRPFNPNKKSKQDIDEASDTYDSVDWLVANVPNNNGRVGIFGISYPGFYATMAIPDAHPAMKAVSPQAPVTDWFIGDDFHHNGAFFQMDAFAFYSSFGRPRPEPTTERAGRFEYPAQDNYHFYKDYIGTVKTVKEKYFGDTIQFWDDLMSHPNYDAFWQARNPRPHLRNVTPAVMTVGGWFDAEDSFGPLRVYEAIEKQNPPSTSNRLVMGPWYHGQWAAGDGNRMGNVFWGFNTTEYYKELELKFFNYYLKDKGTMDIPEATVFIGGANEWHGFATWPPADAADQSLYFHPSEGLSFSPPTTAGTFDEYVSDPMKPVPYTEDVHLQRTREYMTDDQRFAARRPDVMVYQTPVLEEDVTLTGPLEVDLWVSTTGTDADYVVKLIDVFPDTLSDYPQNEKGVPMAGYQMMVRGEILRGRFRNSFEKPEPFKPGEITRVQFQTPDVAHTFKRGHRIMIQVQNSWFPLVDRNPQKFVNIYECDESDFQKATHRIYFDRQHPSRIGVKVLR